VISQSETRDVIDRSLMVAICAW